jgi:LacI family transcriptional regulator
MARSAVKPPKKRRSSRREGQRPTIRDVAELAQVSIGSVSRVLAGKGSLSSELVRKVTNAVETLQYQPDNVARGLRTKATRVIGCFVSDITNPLYGPMVDAAEERARQAGYTLMVASTRNDPRRESELLALLSGRRVDGAILTIGMERQPDLETFFSRLDIPVVVMDRDAPAAIDCVVVDHRDGGRKATDYLISLGHRRIALLTAAGHIRPGRERVEGMRAAFAAADLNGDDCIVRTECTTASVAFAETTKLLTRADRPTAIMALGNQVLAGTVRAIKACRLSIPRDISLISFGDTDLAQLLDPEITTLRWSLADIGRSATELLLQRLDGRLDQAAGVRQIELSTEIVLRGSCGVAPIGTLDRPPTVHAAAAQTH